MGLVHVEHAAAANDDHILLEYAIAAMSAMRARLCFITTPSIVRLNDYCVA